MSSNPYEPPKAELADVPEILPPRPRAVNVAIGLAGGAIVLLVLVNLLALQEKNFEIDRPLMWAARLLDHILGAFLCYQLVWRRNWARIVLLCLTLFKFVQFCYGLGWAGEFLLREENRGLLPRFLFVQVVPLAMTLAALHLLFYSSGDWFRRKR